MRTLAAIMPGRLYMGPRTQTLSWAECTDLITRYGLTAIVNLWHSRDERLSDCPKIRAYIHQPLSDGKHIDGAAVEKVALATLALLQGEHRVLVHCYGGRNRAGLVCALVARRWLGLTGSDAVKLVKAQKPSALVNAAFVQYVVRLPGTAKEGT